MITNLLIPVWDVKSRRNATIGEYRFRRANDVMHNVLLTLGLYFQIMPKFSFHVFANGVVSIVSGKPAEEGRRARPASGDLCGVRLVALLKGARCRAAHS